MVSVAQRSGPSKLKDDNRFTSLTGELIFSNCSRIALVLLLNDEVALLRRRDTLGFITSEFNGVKDEANDWFK